MLNTVTNNETIKNVVDNSTGVSIPFTVRVVFEGDRYGLNHAMTHNKSEPLIEFYDARYNHTMYGQFVSRYYLGTLMEHSADAGLFLHFGVSDWQLSKETMTDVLDWLNIEIRCAFADSH